MMRIFHQRKEIESFRLNSKPLSKWIVAVLAAVIITSFPTAVRSNDNQSRPSVKPVDSLRLLETTNYSLATIDFDRNGHFKDRQQLKELLTTCSTIAQSNAIFMVLYIHGWKHDSNPHDSDIALFQHFLKRFAAADSRLSESNKCPPRKVVGVYVGWSGIGSRYVILNNFSFWHRRGIAETIGYGDFIQLICELEHIELKNNAGFAPQITAGKRNSTKMVIIGHSFGANIVYSAIAPLLVERAIQNNNNPSGIPRSLTVGNGVFLINPVIEASRFAGLERCFANKEFQRSDCALAIFTSETDDANRIAFPVGKRFSSFFDLYANQAERKASYTSIGDYAPYITHDLILSRPDVIGTHRIPYSDSADGNDLQPTQCVLQPRQKSTNPIFNVSVDRRIVPDHGSIDHRVFVRFLTEFIETFSN